jgi:hypothetical protein
MQRLDPDDDTKSVTFRMTARDWVRLQIVAKRDAMLASVWIRALVTQALNRKRNRT